MAMHLIELKELAQDSLGTPETVNFNSLYKVLVGILGQIAALYTGVRRITEKLEMEDESIKVDDWFTGQFSSADKKKKGKKQQGRVSLIGIAPSVSGTPSTTDSGQFSAQQEDKGDAQEDDEEEGKQADGKTQPSKDSTALGKKKTETVPTKSPGAPTTRAESESAAPEDRSGDEEKEPGPHAPSSPPSHKPVRGKSTEGGKEGNTEETDKGAGAKRAGTEEAPTAGSVKDTGSSSNSTVSSEDTTSKEKEQKTEREVSQTQPQQAKAKGAGGKGKKPSADSRAPSDQGKAGKRRLSLRSEEEGAHGSKGARRASTPDNLGKKKTSSSRAKSIEKEGKKDEGGGRGGGGGGGGGRGRSKERKRQGKGGKESDETDSDSRESDYRNRTPGSGGRSTPASVAGDDGEELVDDIKEYGYGSGGRSPVSGRSPSPVPAGRDQVTRKDLDDLASRIVVMENDFKQLKMSKRLMFRASVTDGPMTYSPASSISTIGGSSRDRDNKEALDLMAKREEGLQKRIEMVENDVSGKVDAIWTELRDMQSQLEHLPHPDTLYKSYFPSWKMIEDAMCPYSSLTFNIAEVKEAVEAGKNGQGFSTSKQLSKFLGTSGPSERLLESFGILGRLTEQGREGVGTLTRKVSEGRESISLRRATSGPGEQRYPVEGKAYRKTVRASDVIVESADLPSNSADPTASEVSLSHADDATVDKKAPSLPKSSWTKPGDETMFLNFKFGKMAEETVLLRREITDMQLWKDRLGNNEEDIRSLMSHVLTMRRDMEMTDDKNRELLTNLEMELNEFHKELSGALNKKKDKEEMETYRQRKHSAHQQDNRPSSSAGTIFGNIVIDREARIRTQQLQLQLNAVHQMLAEMQAHLPPHSVLFSPGPAGMPAAMQNPWGTGQAGPGTTIRTTTGGVTPGAAVASTVPSPPFRLSIDARLPPLGGRGSEETETLSSADKKHEKSTSRAPSSQEQLSEQLQQDRDDRLRTQFAIIRLNQTQTTMAARIESCQDQQTSELRRIQSLMTRMHREYMLRCTELEEQINEILGITDTDTVSSDATEKPGADMAADQQRGVSRGGNRRPSFFSQEMLTELKQELLGYIKTVGKKILRLENTIPFLDISEKDAALMKRPMLHPFQCLSCDKKIDVTQIRADAALPPSSVVPELPPLPLLPSPPRLRCHSRGDHGPRAVSDIYEVPRQCGGSYTVYAKRRRPNPFANLLALGDVTEPPVDPTIVAKVAVKGVDGHIYKGQVKKNDFNDSNGFCPPTRPTTTGSSGVV